ncbi:MAG: PD40 domain-containing protein, partial [Anaerolineae bacterium]|nr:PD40 domain-containing protein [Anaerolineae bacterium]
TIVTPTEDVTPEITPTEEITPVVTPTEDVTPEVTPEATATPEVTEAPSEEPTPVTPETPVPTDEPSPEPTPEGVCGDYALSSDGFPIINLSNAPCGEDSEGEVLNFSPIETDGAVCLAEALYHSNGGGTWDIWRTGDGMEAENLSNNPAGVISMAPTRSPNGRYIVYASNADGDWELYLIDLDNADAPPMQLTNNTQAIDLDPVFSPSGRFIAYESNVDGNWEIRLIDLTTGEKFRVTSHPANDINPFWHPDGDSLLFQSDRTGKWQIFSATTIAGTSTASLLSDGVGDDFDPTYSPNGERIAFRSERNGETAIYIMDADGSDVRKVSLDGYTASTPVWDSGNRYIAYQASKAGESLNDIFVYDTVTGETRQLTASVGDMANVQDVAPTWLCNSTTVIFASDVSGNNRLYALNALPMSAPPVDLMGMGSWTENDFNNRDPQNTPSEEIGSRMGALPPRR